MTNAYNVESYADHHHIDDCAQSKDWETLSNIVSTCIPLTIFSGDIMDYKIILVRGSGSH